jgi:hypothetical protein
MMHKHLDRAALAAGALTVAWVAWGYLGHPLALTMTLLIGAFFAMGALELRRFRQATVALSQAVASLAAAPAGLSEWLSTLPEGLRPAVRARVEGERAVLPGPALTPYLVGLLVLLGMLGTFLGMVVTLNGAVIALESTTDLAAIRSALAAPVRGLGVAFGTSVAGAAASAMLGLMSALARRDRQQVSQALDAAVAGPLRRFSRAAQREDALESLQAQSRLLPALATQMQTLMERLDQHSERLGERWLAAQDQAHREAREVHQALARSVEQSLRGALVDSARAAGATIQPVVEQTLGALAAQSGQLHERMAEQLDQRLGRLADELQSAAGAVVQTWQSALERQAQVQTEQQQALGATLQTFGERFHGGAEALLARVDERQAATQNAVSVGVTGWLEASTALQARLGTELEARLGRLGDVLQQSSHAVAGTLQTALDEQVAAQARQQQALEVALAAQAAQWQTGSRQLLTEVDARQAAAQQALSAGVAAWLEASGDLQARLGDELQARLGHLGDALQQTTSEVTATWRSALAEQAAAQARQQQSLETTLGALGEQFQAGSARLLADVDQRQSATQAALAASAAELGASAARQQAATAEAVQAQLDGVAHRLSESVARISGQWGEALAQQEAQQGAVVDRLERALGGFAGTFEERAAALIAQVERLQTERIEAQVDESRQRLQAWTEQLERVGQQLQQAWSQGGAAQLQAQQTLAEQTANRWHAWSEELRRSGDQMQQAWQHSAEALQRRHDAADAQERQRLAEWQQQLQGLSARLQADWQTAADAARARADEQAAQALARQDEWARQLQALGEQLQSGWRSAAELNLSRQSELAEAMGQAVEQATRHTQAMSQRTIDEVATLARDAAEAPRAAAAIIEQLQQRLGESAERDNALLDERQRLLRSLDEVLVEVRSASGDQRAAVDTLLQSSAETLREAAEAFAASVQSANQTLGALSAQMGTDAAEVGSLGEAMGEAVQRFGVASDQLVGQLGRIEQALEQSMQRSDEQLAYTVAQARELIDLSVLSSKRLVDEMRQLGRAGGEAAEEGR